MNTFISAADLLLDEYKISNTDDILTPALAIYPKHVDANIAAMLALLDGNTGRWRPHVKTAKLAFVMQRYLDQGITQFKCATTLELKTLGELGAADVLYAYPAVGAAARRVRDLAKAFPHMAVSALVESIGQIEAWRGSSVGLFVDVNPGMDRTGIDQTHANEIMMLVQAIVEAGIVFRGLHYYDGHLGKLALTEREVAAHRGYDRLIELIEMLEARGFPPPEVITAGTPAFPASLSYAPFRTMRYIHRIAPGTVVYGDTNTLAQLPASFGLRPAALVLASVVSHPRPGRITCDAGHKAVSADADVPTCAVIGWPTAQPAGPSEEHLPIDVPIDSEPQIGGVLYLLPRHVCPTINNFDDALIVQHGQVEALETVTARGHESPLVTKGHE